LTSDYSESEDDSADRTIRSLENLDEFVAELESDEDSADRTIRSLKNLGELKAELKEDSSSEEIEDCVDPMINSLERKQSSHVQLVKHDFHGAGVSEVVAIMSENDV